MRHRPTTADELQRQVDRWNGQHAPGTEVTVRKDHDEIVITKTTSGAYVLGGHSAVIGLQGFSGCFLLDRVTAGVPTRIDEPVSA